MTATPQVIRYDNGSFHILNVDLEPLTRVQRVGLAVRVWPQVRALLEASGEYRERDKTIVAKTAIGSTEVIDKAAAQAAGTDWSAVNKVRPRLIGNTEVLDLIDQGAVPSVTDIARAVGMRASSRLDEGRPSKAKLNRSYYGKGDKFDFALDPILRYLQGWAKREFRFTHVNPREAKRRLKKIDQTLELLQQAREDLVNRSHVATSAMPSEKPRRENS